MKVLYGNSRGNHCIMCQDTEEIYVFDMFGSLISKEGTIGLCNRWVEVDFVSVVGGNENNSEILVGDYKALSDVSLFGTIKNFKEMFKGYIGTVFHINHKDDYGRFTQILLLYNKGMLDLEKIYKEYPKNI